MREKRVVVSSLALGIAASAATVVPIHAQAQMVLEEVIVTARKREESLQETPIAVTALSAQAMEELGVRDISDLRKVAPNVDVYDGNGSTGTGSIYIRGIGARNEGVNFDSGVGLYLDGIYVSRTSGAVLDNVDLQSVQVLRGPQGTLFGKNTTGGAVLYTTNKPSEEFEGHVEVLAGNYDQRTAKVTVNVPLIGDQLLSRVSVYSNSRDGYVTNRANGNSFIPDGEEFNDIDRQGAQVQLRWAASDDVTLDLNYMYSETDQSARGMDCEVVDSIPGSGWQAELQNPFIIVPSTGQTIQEWCAENNALGIDDVMAGIDPPGYWAETNTLGFTLDWELENATFKSITAWRKTESAFSQEVDAIGIPLLVRSNYDREFAGDYITDAYSQEFQLSGAGFDDRLDYVVGLYAFWEDSDSGPRVEPAGPFFNSLFVPNIAYYTASHTSLTSENKAASVFGQADWSFNDSWRLTLGLRYTWEERDLERTYEVANIEEVATTGDASYIISEQFIQFPSGPESFNPLHGYLLPDDPLAQQYDKVDDSDITPMASLQYSFDESRFISGGSAYLSATNGFLSGGISDTLDIETGILERYEPEEVWNYELGLKVDSLNRQWRVNMALFYTDYEDRQLTTVKINPVDGRIAGSLINAESSRIAGIEFETMYLPTDSLQIMANITFNDGKIDEYNDTRILTVPESGAPAECEVVTVGTGDVMNCPVDRSDENLPRLPEAIYYLAAQYTWDTSIGDILAMGAWSYRKDVDNCFDRSSCLSGLYLNDQEDFSARLTWLSRDENIRVTAFGNNLTDERYIVGGVPLVDVTQTAGVVYSAPRMYGLEASYSF
ncbi:TonB-dependent receptor [Halioglobus maricola]|nr:TonB-dependent receptor [Halioglobus maricola]